MTLPFPIQFASNGPQWAQGFDAWYDYTKPQGSQLLAFPPATDTHSAAVSAQSSFGGWQAIPANVPSRTDLGLQTVPTRTNLCLYAFATSNSEWAYSSCSAVAGQSGPSGFGNDAALITCTAVGAASYVTATNTTLVYYTSGTTYTLARFVKAGTQSLVQFTAPSAAFGASQYANFDLATGSVTASAGLVASGITAYQGGWFRIWIAAAATSTVGSHAGAVAFIATGTDGRLPGVTLSTTFTVTGGQVEVGSFPSPPIVTTSSSATVNGNQQVINIGASAANGFGLIMQFNALDATAQFKRIVGISDGTGNNAAVLYWDTGSGTPLQQVVAGAINQGNVIFPGTNSAGLQTIVMVAGPNYSRGQKIGFAAATTDTTVTWPTGLTQLAIGGQGFATTDNMYMQTRRLALRFGPANDAMFNDLVAKATILNAVS